MCTTLRSTERVRLPMISSGICAVANAVLNYLFIFGCPGLEPMGVAGAGLATAITSLMNPLIIYVVSLVQRNILIAPARQLFALRGFLGTYWKARAAGAVQRNVLVAVDRGAEHGIRAHGARTTMRR